jgi:hypothetical protein
MVGEFDRNSNRVPEGVGGKGIKFKDSIVCANQ